MAEGAGASKVTTDHEVIRRWVEERGGVPASVKTTMKNGDAGVLRIDFPGRGRDDALKEIGWDAFFAKFDRENLAFLYQEHMADGGESRFFKIVTRRTAEAAAGK